MGAADTADGVLKRDRHLTTQDGVRLLLQSWEPEGHTGATLFIVHGYADHGARYRELAHFLAPAGVAVSAIDLRGHGGSEGPRGHIDSYEQYHEDIRTALSAIDADALFLLGHSNGALALLDWIGRGERPAAKGLIITSPYLELAMEVPPLKLWAGQVVGRLVPKLALASGLAGSQMSRDPAEQEAYDRDPLVFKKARAGWFLEAQAAQERVRRMTHLPLPLHLVYGDADPVAAPAASRAFGEQVSAPAKEITCRPGARHEVLNELGREELFARLRDWMLERVR